MVNKFVFILLFVLCGSVWADNTGEQSPASSAQEGSPTTAWTNIDSVFASDNQRAIYTGITFDSLYITNFSMGVDADATIDSIFVTTEAQGSSTNQSRRRLKVCLTKDGTTIVGENVTHTHAENTDDVIRSTGPTTPLWNTTWTAAEVNASTFGIVVWKTSNKTSADILIDHATIHIAFNSDLGGAATARRRIILGNQ